MKSDSSKCDDIPQVISITNLLRRLWPSPSDANVTAREIAQALAYIFKNQLSPVQAGALLTCLHFTGWDRRADVLAECALSMREAALQPDYETLAVVMKKKEKARGTYTGGLCDIVGTGGDSHNTYNVSTTSSILASALLLVSKHGNQASTSTSGSADLLQSTLPIPPSLTAVTPESLGRIYTTSNYAFLFAPVFHPGMKYAASIRRDLGWRTIFNLLGPLTNPVDRLLEARVLGVARREIGPVFAEALKILGTSKTLIVCGEENLDEISCAGNTYCWNLVKSSQSSSSSLPSASSASAPPDPFEEKTNPDIIIEHFTLSPSDFGLPSHPLESVSPGKNPHDNAEILMKLLQNQLPDDDPILHFVLMNTSALFVTSGICESDDMSNIDIRTCHENNTVITERGPGGGRWKEGVRLARWAIQRGEAWRQWLNFVQASNNR
ncbi:Anthranilate phosphoribosyltransferase [Golovinomyces cichoracearum]|uniref:Anthranilate phosphoribosyltransferase n=1 Tax=Golovinomyces cichoracearum TaxID=62708 RepID=A0A420HBY2_9PEZI|nr:Anthranilate phosphoribosyltransferase [Golovinomyces cichoracearum]